MALQVFKLIDGRTRFQPQGGNPHASQKGTQAEECIVLALGLIKTVGRSFVRSLVDHNRVPTRVTESAALFPEVRPNSNAGTNQTTIMIANKRTTKVERHPTVRRGVKGHNGSKKNKRTPITLFPADHAIAFEAEDSSVTLNQHQ